MDTIYTIHLEEMPFHALHGLYDLEKKTGNEFELSVLLKYIGKPLIDDINDTINYGTVYETLKAIMQQPEDLLETVMGKMATILKEQYPQLIFIQIHLYKLTVPVAGFKGKMGVSLEKAF